VNPQALNLALIVPDPVLRSGLEIFLGELPQVQRLSVFNSYEGQGNKSAELWADLTGQDILLVDDPPLEFYKLVRHHLPDLPLLIISDRAPIGQISGTVGYCTRLHLAQELPTALDSLAKGRNYYTNYPLSVAPQTIPLSPWQLWRHNLRTSALQRIDRCLLNPSPAKGLEKWIMEGRQRELRTARWLVGKIFPVAVITPTPKVNPFIPTEAPQVLPEIAKNTAKQLVFSRTNQKIRQYALSNLTHFVQEIDILRPQKRQELFLIILQKWELLVHELNSCQLAPAELEKRLNDRQREILLDLWRESTISFIGKYFCIGEVVVVDELLTEAPNLEWEIPQLPEFLLHLLIGKPLTVDNDTWSVGTPTAMGHGELLLDHLLVSIANAVIQPLLNNFAHAEAIKRQFYGSHLLGTREIERFRNDLSWKYRRFRYIDRPRAIFESRYRLFCLTQMGIRYRDIYASRTTELSELRGLAYGFTLLLELQDAIAPRLKSLLSWVGSGVVYILTNVIGRGLGLIGRGVLQGIGSAFRG
jgi:hypothetical protein